MLLHWGMVRRSLVEVVGEGRLLWDVWLLAVHSLLHACGWHMLLGVQGLVGVMVRMAAVALHLPPSFVLKGLQSDACCPERCCADRQRGGSDAGVCDCHWQGHRSTQAAAYSYDIAGTLSVATSLLDALPLLNLL